MKEKTNRHHWYHHHLQQKYLLRICDHDAFEGIGGFDVFQLACYTALQAVDCTCLFQNQSTVIGQKLVEVHEILLADKNRDHIAALGSLEENERIDMSS